MAREKRKVSTFSLSFLDIMACGFGAVTLLFMLLKHDASPTREPRDTGFQAEASLLAEDIRVGELEKVQLRNSLRDTENEVVKAQGESQRVLDQLDQRKRELSVQKDPDQQIALLRKQIKVLEDKTANLHSEGRADDTRRFIGEGDRQYLTGLKLGGQRVLILVDSSASMLAETIVNVVRRRNMSDNVKRNSAKWLRAVHTVEWLVSQLPRQSHYQIYTFNTEARALTSSTKGQWLAANDSATLDDNIAQLKTVTPQGGTSLYAAFSAANGFPQRPDNIFLLTDGLPTVGQSAPQKNTVSGQVRNKLFREALKALPKRASVNVILFPMEGDPEAAALFWQLGLSTGGAFLSPSRDWP